MKIDAKIRWVIDDDVLGIVCNSTETVPIDVDYTEADKNSVAESAEYELQTKYGANLITSFAADDGHDFVIENIDEIVAELHELSHISGYQTSLEAV